MRAIAMDGFGGVEVMRMAEVPRPPVRAGHVVVRAAYAGVNPADWKVREGWLSAFFQYQFPFVLGFDVAGVVAELGEGVTGLSVGDRVVAASNQGAGEWGSYAEFVLCAAERTVRLPPSVTLRDAATLPTAGMTAWEAVFDVGATRPGSCVLVNGGAGGTGSFAIQLARMAGARVAATCSAGNADYVRGLGAERVIDYRTVKISDAVRHWAPEGADLAIDTVGQGTLIDAPAFMRRGGIIAPIATLIANEPTVDAKEANAAGVQVRPTMSTFPNQPRQLRGLVTALAEARIRAPDVTVLPLSETPEAHRRVQAGHVRGKIVLEIDGSLQS